jgi:hypothetical protein
MRACAVVVVVLVTGCMKWSVIDRVVEHAQLYRYRLTLRDDLLSGRAKLRDDGTIEFALALDHACTLVPQLSTHRYVTYERELTTTAAIALTVGAAALTVASFAAVSEVQGSWVGYTAGIGGVTFAVPVVMWVAGHKQVTRETIEPKPIDGRETRSAPCRGIDPIAALGELELVTPWGVRVVAPIDRDGVARFVVDWSVAPENEYRLAAAWTVMATRSRISGTWRFSTADATRALGMVRAVAYGNSGR